MPNKINDEVINLGLVLRNLDNFDMSTFDGRLTLQKTIYLMQAFGIYLGHNFSWYLRGPYSSHLASVGFALQDIYHRIPTAGYFEKETQRKFDDFIEFMNDKKTEPDRLEILASIHFLKKIYPSMSKAEIIEKVKNKQKYFTKKQCEEAWKELKEVSII
ncbi:MAG: hypothetical protein IIC67_01735 [Thaumarchaeota archaeon]|nr:hypothetical protein [Nitrososphaerota archaeon]